MTVLAALAASTSWAQAPGAPDPGQRRLLGIAGAVPLAQDARPEVGAVLQDLRRKAAGKGGVRVIAGVRAGFAPEGQLSAAQVRSQRAEIALAQQAVLAALPAAVRAGATRFEQLPFVVLQVDAAQLEALAASGQVTDLQEDRVLEPSLAQSVPLVRADLSWTAGATGTGWAVAVLDNGIDKTHPFVASSIVSEACYSTPNVASGVYSLCPGGASSSTAAGSASVCTNATFGNWACDHGTHVAGIALGDGADGGVAFSGVAKGASLVSLQVFHWNSTVGGVRAYTSDIVRGLERVAALSDAGTPIAVANMSLGGGQYFSQGTCDSSESLTKAAVDNLRSRGIATVVASGNAGYTDSLAAPACISTAISVGSTWDEVGWTLSGCVGGVSAVDKVVCNSNSASFLDMLAPGYVIQSSVPGNLYAIKGGTSMAAPHVAGCWAILKAAKPSATVSDIKASLLATGTPVTDYRNGIVKPRLDCEAARQHLLGTVSIGAATYSVNEGTATVTIPVTRSSTAGTASVTYATANGTATAGSDYTAKSGTLSFPAGVATQNVVVSILNDAVAESGETFTVTLSAPSGAVLGGIGSTTITIVDDDPVATVAFGSATHSVTEGTSSVTIPVTRSSSAGTASVNYATANGSATAGSDYTAKSGTLNFAAGVTTQNVVVSILNDTTMEPAETFTVALSSPVGATLGSLATTTVTIADNDAPTVAFGSAAYSVREGTASVTLVVRRSSTAGTSAVNYSMSSGTATAGSDYTGSSGTLNFAAGVGSVNLVVPIVNDTLPEGDETFTVTLASPVGATLGGVVQTTVTIQDNDATVSFGNSKYSVNESAGSVTIPVTRSNTTTAASVNYATSNGTAAAGSDYSARSGTLSFDVGVATLNVVVPLVDDTLAESNETFKVTLSAPTGMSLGTTAQTTVTILDDEPKVSFGSATVSVVESAGVVTLPVTRTSTVGTATVNYATANATASAGSDYTATSGTLTFQAGVATLNVVVPVLNDTSAEGNETFQVALSSPVGMGLGTIISTTVTIGDDDATVSFGSATYSVGEAGGSVTIPVTRSSTVGTATVDYATANGTAVSGSDYTARSGKLTFSSGVATVNIVIPIANDTAVEGSQTFTVSLKSPFGLVLGSIAQTTVTILDND